MELRVLRYFLAVAREETILAAAETLHVTQPTLSRQLMDLEQELGRKLFIRGNRRITLTEDGMLLRKRAQEIISLVDKTEADFLDTGEEISGDIYIGAGETDAMRLVARAIRALRTECPGVRVHLFSGNAEGVTERLDRGLLDFGILIEPADIHKYEYLRLPAMDRWGLLMRADDPLASKKVIRPADLAGINLLTSRQVFDENGLGSWAGEVKLNIIATYNLIYNAAIMVEEGVGAALALDKLVNVMGDGRLCFRPLEPGFDVGLNLVWKKYQLLSRVNEKFLECLKKETDPRDFNDWL